MKTMIRGMLVAIAVAPFLFAAAGAPSAGDGVRRYFELQKRYLLWHRGLFGSRKTHEHALKEFLRGCVGSEIETDDNFILEDPDGASDLRVRCKFGPCRWLYVYGVIGEEEIRALVKERPELEQELGRTHFQFAIKGKLEKYRLNRDTYGDTVELYLKKIMIVR